MNRYLPAVLALIGMASAAPSSPPLIQGQGGPPQVAFELLQAWVWPAWGDDASGAINDPTQPYKSIQAAIDALNGHILQSQDMKLEGLVWCMPGVYGPTSSQVHGPSASGDVFPIQMKHRVHVRGVSARRCIIRGVNQADLGLITPWPVYTGNSTMNCQSVSNREGLQVLVTFRFADKYISDGGVPKWWAGYPEVDEILDGFTFQGGDVQVSFDMPDAAGQTWPQSGRVSNCIFDMRHMPGAAPTPIEGPEIGILLSSRFDKRNPVCGYFDQKVHIANNTFVMSEYRNGTWQNDARVGSVGIINTTDPHTTFEEPFDVNPEHRGLGNPGLQNNIFRTRPENLPPNTGTMALVGIDATDCVVREGGSTGAYVPTNAFAPNRAGMTSGLFTSTPVLPSITGFVNVTDLWFQNSDPMWYDAGVSPDCNPELQLPDTGLCLTVVAAPLPVPAVVLWNGSTNPVNEHDPGFVGEFLTQPQANNPVLPDYADWRLLPGSPMIDQGRLWEVNEFQNGSMFIDHHDERLSLRRWDGEGWGNVRVHGSNGFEADIGFDEVHLGVMAGSYANGSNSHNKTTFLNPSAAASQSERRILLPEFVLGLPVSGSTLRVKATERQVALPIPPWTMSAWSQPPVTLASPLVNGSLPVGFQTAYINFAAERWTVGITGQMVLTTAPAVQVPGNSPWSVVQVELPPDDEGANYTSHFNSQFVLDGGAFPTELRGNIQPEYR